MHSHRHQLSKRFDRGFAEAGRLLLLLGLALVVFSGCASSPPPTRWYSQAEASSAIERLAGSSVPPGVVIFPYYEEAWSIQQPNEFMQSRFTCNKSMTLTGKSALKLTISGNFVEGELIDSDDCGDVSRASLRGRFNENHLFVQFGAAGSGTAIRRYKIADGGRMLMPEVNMTLSGTHTYPRNGQIMKESRNGKTYWTTEFVAAANGSQREQQLVEEARDGARAAKQARNESERADQSLAMALLQAPQASAPRILPGAVVPPPALPQSAKTQTARPSGPQSPASTDGSGLGKSRQPALQLEKVAGNSDIEPRDRPRKTTLYQCALAAHIGPGGKTYFSTITTVELPHTDRPQEFRKQAMALAGRPGPALCQVGTEAELAKWRDSPGFRNTHIQTNIAPE